MFIRNNILAASIALAALASSHPCRGQSVEMNAEPANYVQEVIITGSQDLSPQVIEMIGGALSKRMRSSLKGDGSAELSSVELVFRDATIGTNAQIGLLFVGCRGFDDSQKNLKRKKEFWEQGRKQLEAALRQVQQIARDDRQNGLEVQQMNLVRQRDGYAKKVEEAIARLEILSPDSSGSPEQLQAQLAEMVTQLRQLRLERTSIAARREAIDKRVDELRDVAERSVADDPVIDELEKVVEIREQQYKIMRQQNEAGLRAISSAEVAEASAAVAAARIELLKAKRSAAADASGAALASLNDELSKLIIQDAELKAKEGALEEIVAMLQKQTSVKLRTEVAATERLLNSARSGLTRAEDYLRDAETRTEVDWQIAIRPLEDALPAPEAAKGK